MCCKVVGCGLVRLLVVATCVVGHSGPKLAIVYWRPGQLALEPKMQPHKEVDEVFSGPGFGQDIMGNVYGLCCWGWPVRRCIALTDVRQKNKNFCEDSDQKRITRFSNNQPADLSRNFDKAFFQAGWGDRFFKIQSMPFIPKKRRKGFCFKLFEMINTGLLFVLCRKSKIILGTRQLWMDKVVRYWWSTGRFFIDVLLLEVFGTVKKNDRYNMIFMQWFSEQVGEALVRYGALGGRSLERGEETSAANLVGFKSWF